MPRGTGHTNDSQALWARSLEQRFWLENCRICLQFTYCGNVSFFTSWYVSAFSLVSSIYCAKVCQACFKHGELFSLRWFQVFSPRACLWKRVFLKSRLIALLNVIFAFLSLVLCFISCWKNILFSLLSRLFVAKNSFYNHINFYVEVTNALKVVYREVLIHRPYNKKTTENGIWNIRLLMSRVFRKSRLIALRLVSIWLQTIADYSLQLLWSHIWVTPTRLILHFLSPLIQVSKMLGT